MYIKNVLLSFVLFSISVLTFANTKFFRASYRDDPATTIVIGWCDNGTSTNAKIYYGTSDLGTNYVSYPFNHGIDRTQSHVGQTHRFARLTGLAPNTIYYFVIHDDQGNSARMSFKTMPDNPNTPIMFISGGDTRTGAFTEFEYTQCRTRRQDGNKLVAKIRPDFVAFSGDYIFSEDIITGTTTLWSDWLTDWQLSIGPEGRLFPILPTYGNHELTADVNNIFDTPNTLMYYALNFGNLLRFYTIGSDLACGTAQLNWLTNDLQLYTNTANAPYWKSVQYHIPLVPHGQYSPSTDMISCWTPLFQQYKITLSMDGHSHVQKVTFPLVPSSGAGSDNGFVRDDVNGTVYIGEGCWGAPLRDVYTYYNANQAYNWTRAQGKFAGFNVVYVSKQKMEIRTVKFLNVSSVGQVSASAAVGTLPTGLSLWDMNGSTVVTIMNTNPLSNDAALNSLATASGILTPAFVSTTLNYAVDLPGTTSQVPACTFTTNHPAATVVMTPAVNLAGTLTERTTTIIVTAEDGVTTNTYTVVFSISPHSDATLASLTASQGTLNPTFLTSTLNYTVSLPSGTVIVPTVSATATDPTATVQITQVTSVNGTAIIHVISADGTSTKDYTVVFSVATTSSKEILTFTIPGQTGQSQINQAGGTVVVTMPLGTNITALVPAITISGVSISPVSGTSQNFTNPVSYTVTAADNSTKTYQASVVLLSTNNDANLDTLYTNIGTLNPVFAPQTTNYSVNLPLGTTSVQIFAEAHDPNAEVHIYPPSNLSGNLGERTGVVLVKASDNVTTKVYSIAFQGASNSGVYEITNDPSIKVFPNPVSDKLKIQFTEIMGEVTIEIYNGFSRLVDYEKRNITAEQTVTMPFHNLEHGVYYVIIRSKKGTSVSKVFHAEK
jgi:hypothetical protein